MADVTATPKKAENNVLTLCLTGPRHAAAAAAAAVAAATTKTATNSKSKKKTSNNNNTTSTSTGTASSSGGSRREIVHFHKTRATVQDLYLRAEDLFGNNHSDAAGAAAAGAAEIAPPAPASGSSAKKKTNSNNSKKKKNKTNAARNNMIMVLERRCLTAGFPPRLQRLDRHSHETLQQAGIENQERITVSFVIADEETTTQKAPPLAVESSSMNGTATATAPAAAAAAAKPGTKKRNGAAATVSAAAAAAEAKTDDNKAMDHSKKTNNKRSNNDDDFDDDDDDDRASCSEDEDGNNNNDNANATTTATTAAASSPTRTGSKRAAAQRATESFAATMAAQDALVRQQQQSANKKRPAAAAASGSKRKAARTTFTANRTSAGRRLQDGAVVSRPTISQRRRRVAGANDNDLINHDDDPQAKAGIALLGALNGSRDSSSAARLVRRGWRRAVLDAYEQNQATARLAAVATMAGAAATTVTTVAPPEAAGAPSGGASLGGGGGVVQFQCWKPAGDHSPSLVAVNAEETAVLTEDEGNGDTADAGAARKATWQLEVKYPKGVQGRGNYEERVDYISHAVLKSLIRSIYPVNAEALRPENLAHVSPRVLWSLLFHWQRRQGRDNDGSSNSNNNHSSNTNKNAIHEALMTMHPDLDWSFLRRRKQQLSEKALENLRQQQAKGSNSDSASTTNSVGQDYEAAAAAISAVEQAMQDSLMTTTSVDQRQARMLQAAQQRAFAPASDENTVMDEHAIIVTPTEADEDELKACILAAVLASGEDHGEEAAKDEKDDADWDKPVISIEQGDGSTRAYTIRTVVDALIRDCGIHNWRQLANSKGADALVQQLFEANSSSKNSHSDDDALIDMVQAWIDHAREESLDEIMVEICQGRIEAVELLAHAKAATPKDLAPWKWIVDDLYNLLQQAAVEVTAERAASVNIHNDPQRQQDTPPELMTVPTKQDLEKWCQRAQWAMEQWEWLADYATPIEY